MNFDLRIVNLHWQLMATNSTRTSTGPDTCLYDRRSVPRSTVCVSTQAITFGEIHLQSLNTMRLLCFESQLATSGSEMGDDDQPDTMPNAQ